MSYTETFGGATLYPSGESYLTVALSASIELSWPTEQQISGQDVVASIMDVTASTTGLSITMPDARAVSEGIQVVFTAVGGDDFDVVDNTGGAIITLSDGEAWVLYLTDNTTQAGTWRSFQLGATVAAANAAALAGAGLKAISTTLNQRYIVDLRASTPFTLVDADRAQLILYTSGAGVGNLPDPATVGSDWFCLLRNEGSGALVVTPPSGTIDGLSTVTFNPGDSGYIITDGTNFYTVGFGSGGSGGAFGHVNVSLTGAGATYQLTPAEQDQISYTFIGVLGNDVLIEVPQTVQQYWVGNDTTGAFTLTIGTAVGTPLTLTQGEAYIVYCDGTDMVNAVSVPATSPASETVAGIAELATQAETDAGSDDLRIVTPLKLANRTASETLAGIIEIATQVETDAGADDTLALTPLKLNDWADQNAGILLDLLGLSSPGTNRLLIWNNGTGAAAFGIATNGIQFNGGNLELDIASLVGGTPGARTDSLATLVAGNERETTFDNLLNAASLQATAVDSGFIELATQAEVDAGTDATRAVTPDTLDGRQATTTLSGLGEIATQAEVDAGSDTTRWVTPATLAGTTLVTAGSLILLDEQTASSSASIDFTSSIDGTYDSYVIECLHIVPATNNVDLYIRCGSGSFDSGANNYAAQSLRYAGGATSVNGGAAIFTEMAIMRGNFVGNSYWIDAFVRMIRPASAGLNTSFSWEGNAVNTSGAMDNAIGGGYRNATQADDRIQFFFSSGNIASGTFKLYGVV